MNAKGLKLRVGRWTWPKSKRCVIVQLEDSREEVIPSLVQALVQIGYRPVVYINRNCRGRRGDVFAGMPAGEYEVHHVATEHESERVALARAIRMVSFDFAVLSSFDRASSAEWAGRLGLPAIGVVHVGADYLGWGEGEAPQSSAGTGIVCMAPHVAAWLHHRLPPERIDDIAVIEPVYLGEGLAVRDFGQAGQRRGVAIPGTVSYDSRAYGELVDALSQDRELREAGLDFHIVGAGPDLDRLRQSVEASGLAKLFRFTPIGSSGEVQHEAGFEALRQSHFIHPLLPFSSANYREQEITLAPALSVGLAVPSVLDRWTARSYRISCVVSDASVKASLQALSAVTPKQHGDLKRELVEARKAALARNAEEMGRLVSRLVRPDR